MSVRKVSRSHEYLRIAVEDVALLALLAPIAVVFHTALSVVETLLRIRPTTLRNGSAHLSATLWSAAVIGVVFVVTAFRRRARSKHVQSNTTHTIP